MIDIHTLINMSSIFSYIKAFILNMTVLLLTYDIMCWGLALFQHSRWLRVHPQREEIDCDRITHRMLGSASVLSGTHMMLINLSWVYFKVYYGYNMPIFIMIVGIDVMVIHLFVLLARCTELDKAYWPYVSKYMGKCAMSPCRLLVGKFFWKK